MLTSHPGSSYGSFVSNEGLSIKDAMEMVSKLIDYSSKKGFDGIQLTIPPGFHSNRLSNYIEYSLLINGFDYLRRDVTSILAIESSEDKILNKFKPSHQRALRKSKKLRNTLVKFRTAHRMLSTKNSHRKRNAKNAIAWCGSDTCA